MAKGEECCHELVGRPDDKKGKIKTKQNRIYLWRQVIETSWTAEQRRAEGCRESERNIQEL